MKNQLPSRVLMLAAALLMYISPAVAQDLCENGIYYYIWDYDEVVVAQSPDGYSGDIVIPSSITTEMSYYGETYEQTYNVVGIDGYAFKDCAGLTRVNLPPTLTWIGESAFYGCTSLAEINLPASLTSIGSTAFGYCTLLKTVEVPAAVEYMDWNVFYYCSGLTSVTLHNQVTALNGTFMGCSSLTSIDIPATVKRLDGVFTGCSSLTAVTLPAGLTYIGDRTFDGCTALQSLLLPSSLTYIGEQAFRNCDKIQFITSRALTPPSMYSYNSECFDYIAYTSAKLYVPNASIADYKSTDWWSLFQNIMGLVYLNSTSVTLTPGETFQLNAQLAPGFEIVNAMEWSSDKTSVATVSPTGLVTAIAKGSAIIIVKADDEQAVCEVTVKAGSAPGDVNNDGEVNVADINALINAILKGGVSPEETQQFDTNGDGEVNVADVNWLIDYVLNH